MKYSKKNVPVTEKIQCAVAIGAALGTFHQEFIHYNNDAFPEQWLTYTHGDLHPGNVFFHKTAYFSRIYFIDNESMAHSLDSPKSIGDDVSYFYLTARRLINAGATCSFHDIAQAYHHFLKAYVKSYPKPRREALVCYLEEEINKTIQETIMYTSSTTATSQDSTVDSLRMLLIENKNLTWYML